MAYNDPAGLREHLGETVRVTMRQPYVDVGYAPFYEGVLVRNPLGIYVYRAEPPLISGGSFSPQVELLVVFRSTLGGATIKHRFTTWVDRIEPIPTDEPDFFEE